MEMGGAAVAFTAKNPVQDYSGRLVFSDVVTNAGGGYDPYTGQYFGGGYDPYTGVFTAPSHGLYYFSLHVLEDVLCSKMERRSSLFLDSCHLLDPTVQCWSCTLETRSMLSPGSTENPFTPTLCPHRSVDI
ncbi:hypothetical protein NQD34_013921 [Periophthalmus magnuspinnatus]|nr:hypothetical protein NQD34_013921 [Periophthalmus magnuspinnatus]